MHILYLDWPCFCGTNVLDFFCRRGYEITRFSHEDYHLRTSDSFFANADRLFQEKTFDFCFSYNFFPLMANVCKKYNLKYISFVYDSPQVKLYSYTVTYPTNYIFVFDSDVVQTFRKNNITTFYYMPLPVDGTLIHKLLEQPYDKNRCSAEISFIGALYNEDHNFLDRLTNLSDYTKSYIDGIMQAQKKVYGYNFIEDCLPPHILDELQKEVNYTPNEDGVETLSYIFADYYINRKLTSIERIELLRAVSSHFPLKLFTFGKNIPIPNIQNMGVADYYTEMPYIFYNSKINLNISLRSIKTGIPLRCMDIMGSGGFLLTNFQSDFLLHFVPDEEFVYFENESDLIQKIDYYLSHDEKRRTIAQAGYDKVLKNHNFDIIFDAILNIVFPS